MRPNDDLKTLLDQVIRFVESHRIAYALIGGITVGVWGLPRRTNDLDVVVQISTDHYDQFVRWAIQAGFKEKTKKAREQLKRMGMCRLFYGKLHVDFIMGYSEFEKAVFRRKKQTDIFGHPVFVASPEDIILYKLLAAREIDLADIRTIIMTQGTGLDADYLRLRAKRMLRDLGRPDITANLEKYLGHPKG